MRDEGINKTRVNGKRNWEYEDCKEQEKEFSKMGKNCLSGKGEGGDGIKAID